MRDHGNPWKPWETHVSQLELMKKKKVHGSPWRPTWKIMGAHERPMCNLWDTNGSALAIDGNPWATAANPWKSMEVHWGPI